MIFGILIFLIISVLVLFALCIFLLNCITNIYDKLISSADTHITTLEAVKKLQEWDRGADTNQKNPDPARQN